MDVKKDEESHGKKNYQLKIFRARCDLLPVRAKLTNSLFLTFCRAGGTIILNSIELLLSLFNGPQANLYLINNLLMQLKVDVALILSLLGSKILTKKQVKEDKRMQK